MQAYNKSYSEIIKRINSTRKKEANLEFITAVMKFLAITAVALLLISIIELILNHTFQHFYTLLLIHNILPQKSPLEGFFISCFLNQI